MRVRGTTPYYGANGIQDYVEGFTHDGEFVLVAEDGANDLKNYPVQYVEGHIWVNNHAHVLQGKNKITDTRFLGYAISRANIEAILVGGGRAKLNAEVLMRLVLILPGRAEQVRLSSYLAKLDSLLSLHQRKLEKLKILKKAMLEKMFPKNGAKVPEIRFSGFTDDWELRKLGEMSSLITKGTTPLDKSNTGNVNFVKIESIDEASGEITITKKITNEEHEGYLRRSQLKENDILFSIAGTLGRVTSVKSSILPANTNQALAIIRRKTGDLQYVKTYLKGKVVSDYIKKNPTIGAQPNLSLEQVGNLEIALPILDEQKKIGEYFSGLDNLLSLHQRKPF